MPSEGQAGLADFTPTTDRPTAEARAVAGGTEGTRAASETLAEASGHVEVALQAIDYTLERTDAGEESPVIHLFARTADGDPEHIRVRGFRPYFYVPVDEADRLRDDDRVTGVEDGFTAIDDTPLTRVYAQTPRDVGQLREGYTHYEADVRFPNRLLIDRGLKRGVRVPERRDDDGVIDVTAEEIEPAEVAADPRVFFFDIEVDDRRGFPEDGEEPIISIAAHDSGTDRYLAWLYVAPDGEGEAPDELDGFEPLVERTTVELRRFDDEAAMLDDFIAYVESYHIDVMSGWNLEDFDAPYLLDRLERIDGGTPYDLSIDRLSRVGEVWRSNFGGPDIKGRVVFDLLYAYRRTQFTELDSYRLDAVAEHELGVGKERYPGSIGDLWEQDPERLLEYNVRDVELCVELDRKQQVIAFWDEVRSLVGCQLEDAPTPGDTVDMYILHKVYGDFVLPSRGRQESQAFEGGAVFDPISGIRENVSVLDLKSLYPMVLRTINGSPETKVDPTTYEGDTFRAPNGTAFRKDKEGIIREIVDELLKEREAKKAMRNEHPLDSPAYERYDRQQAAVKVIMNSVYGILTYTRFRLYDLEMGSAVTSTGRAVIEYTADIAEQAGYDLVYGDSVAGDRPIVVRDPDGILRIAPIARLFDHASPRITPAITTDGGHHQATRPPKEWRQLEGWEALSLAEDGTAEWQPITAVIRHATDKPVVRLRHKFGESTTTRDHSYIVEEDGRFVERPPSSVDEPLRIPDIPTVDRIQELDLYEALKGYRRERAPRGSKFEVPNRVQTDGTKIWFGRDGVQPTDGTITLKRHIDLSSDDGLALIRLVAAYAAEGSASTIETTDTRFGASIAGGDRDWLETIQADYHRLFSNVTTSIVQSDSRGERTLQYEIESGMNEVTYNDETLKLQMMNELSAIFFRQLAGQTSRGKFIPDFIYHVADDLQHRFIEILIEGDGSRKFPRYSDEYQERHFDFETTSRQLAAGLSILLIQRGQKHSLKFRDEKGTYTIRTCDYYRRGRDPVLTEVEQDGYVYDLSVEKNENFVDAVGGIVLHNTDSVMLEIGDEVDQHEAIDRAFEIQSDINDSYDDFAREELNAEEHYFEIEFEKLYRRFFQAGKKKRYAGHIVYKEGKEVDDIDITGFEYQRSDIAPITKEVQHEVLERIVREGDVESVKEYLHDIITRFEDGAFSLDEIAIPGGIGKRLDNYETDTAHVRGAKYANLLLGTNFDRGAKPKRLYLEKVHPDYFTRIEAERGEALTNRSLYDAFKRDPDVICFEYADQVPEEFAVDYPKMLDKTLKGPISRILEALDLTWDEVKAGQTQTGLGQF